MFYIYFAFKSSTKPNFISHLHTKQFQSRPPHLVFLLKITTLQGKQQSKSYLQRKGTNRFLHLTFENPRKIITYFLIRKIILSFSLFLIC